MNRLSITIKSGSGQDRLFDPKTRKLSQFRRAFKSRTRVKAPAKKKEAQSTPIKEIQAWTVKASDNQSVFEGLATQHRKRVKAKRDEAGEYKATDEQARITSYTMVQVKESRDAAQQRQTIGLGGQRKKNLRDHAHTQAGKGQIKYGLGLTFLFLNFPGFF